MSKPLKSVFKSKAKVFDEKEGKEVEKEVVLAIVPPSADIRKKAGYLQARTYAEALKNKALMREQLNEYLREANLWNDAKEEKFQEIRKFLNETELKLAQGGTAFESIEEAKAAAIEMGDKRAELTDILSIRNAADQRTADALAEQAEFDFLVAHCTVYNETGKPFFTTDGEHGSYEHYVDNKTEQVAFDAANKLAEVKYGTEKDVIKNYPENQWLLDYGFVDDDFHLVREDGRRVDRKGRLVDKEGRFINEDGEYVDAEGNRVDKDGKPIVNFKPFVGKDGKPIIPKSKKGDTPPPAPMAKPPKKEPEAPAEG